MSSTDPFQYLAFDAVSSAVLDPLPYQDVAFSDLVNAPGTFVGTLDLADPRVQRLNWQLATRTGRTVLVVMQGTTVVWAGIIWTRRYKASDTTLTIGASGFGSYFKKRLQGVNYTAVSGGWAYWTVNPEDPMNIAAQIFYDSQLISATYVFSAGSNVKLLGGFSIVIHGATTGANWISPKYPIHQLQKIDDMISTLAEMGYGIGFDYSFDTVLTAGVPVVTLNFWHPRKGNASAPFLTITRNQVIDFTWDEDSSTQANGIFETATKSGGLQGASFLDTDSITAGYPVLEDTISHSQVTDGKTLAALGAGDLFVISSPITSPQLTLPIPTQGYDATKINLSDFKVGDDAVFRIDAPPKDSMGAASYGMNNDPRFPNGESFEFRIDEWEVKVTESGVATLTLTLGVRPQLTDSGDIPPLG